MLYEITVFRIDGKKKTRINSMEVWANDPVNAVEKACLRLGPERMAEIKEIHPLPSVNRIERDGVI